MPIKTLESYLFERKLANASSIEILQNATIGIDVDHYLSRIYTFKKEQFLAGIGGIPSSVKDYIKSDLQVFKEFNIRPLFVVSGLNTQLQSTRYSTNELSPQEQHVENTWNKLGKPYSYNSIDSFRLFTDPLPLRPIINDLIKYFIDIGIDYLVAPYDTSFQLSYLYQNKVVDSIYGSTDLLLTKIDKFILGMEFQSKDFRFIDKRKVLHELNLSERQFLDLSIMVGCNIQRTTFPNFPPLPKPNTVQPYPQLSYFKLGLDIIYQYNSFNGNNTNDLFGYIVSLNDPKLLELYFKGHSAIKFLPILNKEGYVELYNVEMAKLGYEDIDFVDEKEPGKGGENGVSRTVKVPNDVHEIISQRLPAELYFYQSIGLLPIELLEAITQGHLDVRPNLEGGFSNSYRKLITSTFYKDNLDQQCNLLTQLLARYYQVKKINVKYWFKDQIVEVNNRLTPPIFKRVEGLSIQNDGSSDFDLVSFFKKLPENGEGKYVAKKPVESRDDILSTVLLRTLYLYDLLDKTNQDLGSIPKILKRVGEELNVSYAEFQELVLLLLLIQSKTIKLNEPNKDFSNVPKHFKEATNAEGTGSGGELSPEVTNYITLISRVFSLHKFNISPINYQGPISRNLLNFRSHVSFISSTLINTIQCVLVDFIVHQKSNLIKNTYGTKQDWYKLVDQLPFYKQVNSTLMGVAGEIYFEYAERQSKAGKEKEEVIKNTREHLLNHVYQVSNTSYNINVHGVNAVNAEQFTKDFDNAVGFWHHFVKLTSIINEVDPTLVDDTYLKEIAAADAWLKLLT